MEHELIAKSLRCCADYSENFTCSNCGYYSNGCRRKMLPGAATAIEELMAQVKDKDYLIQQQADEIELLRRDVKKQQKNMIELAKKLPKRGEWIDGEKIEDPFLGKFRCSVCGHAVQAIEYNYEQKTVRFTCGKSNYCPNCGAKMEDVK